MADGALRALRPSDLPQVVSIERATFSDPWSLRSFQESLREEHIVALALDDTAGRLVGYGLASVVVDEGEVLNLAVEPAARGRGYGRALLAGLLAALREEGARKVWLEVRRSNEAAIALYRAAGFQSLGVRLAYYGSPKEDALTMSMELGSQ